MSTQWIPPDPLGDPEEDVAAQAEVSHTATDVSVDEGALPGEEHPDPSPQHGQEGDESMGVEGAGESSMSSRNLDTFTLQIKHLIVLMYSRKPGMTPEKLKDVRERVSQQSASGALFWYVLKDRPRPAVHECPKHIGGVPRLA